MPVGFALSRIGSRVGRHCLSVDYKLKDVARRVAPYDVNLRLPADAVAVDAAGRYEVGSTARASSAVKIQPRNVHAAHTTTMIVATASVMVARAL